MHQRAGSGDSQGSQGAPTNNRQSYRQSAWGGSGGGGKRNVQGPMGVTGAG